MSDNLAKEFVESGFVVMIDWSKIKNISVPVIPAVAVTKSGEVLGIFYLDETALKRTITLRQLSLYSTSRNKAWIKGEESGNTFTVQKILINCEQNSLVIVVSQDRDGICHVTDTVTSKPHTTCFYREIDLNDLAQLKFR